MGSSVTEVLEEGFQLISKNYTKFLLLYLIIAAFYLLLIFIAILGIFLLGLSSVFEIAHTTASTVPTGAALVGLVFFFIILLGIIFFIEPIWIGAYYSMALQGLSGEISVTKALQQATEKYIPLLWTMALEALIIVVIDAIIFSPLILVIPAQLTNFTNTGSASSTIASSLFTFLGLALLLLFVYLIVTAVLAPLLYEAVPLVLLENVSGVKALKESIDIGEKHFWNILFLVIGIGVIIFGINFLTGVIVGIVQILSRLAADILNIIISLFIGSFTSAWLSALPIIFYRDYLANQASAKKVKGS